MAKPKIFVSHSSLDTAFASNLVDDLNAAGAQAWIDSNELGAGDFQQRISEALANCEWFLLVLTRNALASPWVPMEVNAAIGLKHQKRIKELIFIKAAEVERHEPPALWNVFNVFDATTDYRLALTKTLREVGLSPVTPAPTPIPTSAVDPTNLKKPSRDDSMRVLATRLAGEAHIGLGEKYYREQQYGEALKAFDSAIDYLTGQQAAKVVRSPDWRASWIYQYKRAWDGKYRALERLGRHEEAAKAKEISLSGW